MAVPDYFHRNAVAIAQTLSGLDEIGLERILRDVCVGVAFDSSSIGSEGHAIVDLLIRLLARLYPAMSIRDDAHSNMERYTAELATRVNPNIDLSQPPSLEVVIGPSTGARNGTRTIFVGSDGWTAKLSDVNPQTSGISDNPFGAGLAACLAAARIFRNVFLHDVASNCDLEIAIPTLDTKEDWRLDGNVDIGRVVLAGAGAIGNSAIWALSRTKIRGSIEIVDHEKIDLGNLQRYVLAERSDEDKPKAEFLAGKLCGSVKAEAYGCSLSEFLELRGYKTDTLLLALDSAKDRCGAQASLPRRIINSWTQPNDLGVSIHDFMRGACVNCLYLPTSKQRNEDEIIADAFGIPDQIMDIRNLLYTNEGASVDLLNAIAQAANIDTPRLLPFEGRTLRDLYVDGFCGGAVIPLDEIGTPADDVHVPLAHQSALAGILLAASTIGVNQHQPKHSLIAQIDLLKAQESFQTYPVAKDNGRRCICQDEDYINAYQCKYEST